MSSGKKSIQNFLAHTTRPAPKSSNSKPPSNGGISIKNVLAATTRPPPKGTNSKPPTTGTKLPTIQKAFY
ncbi:hypothetical protein JHK82_020814 [Glycine max]|uniref:Uncharacterized protein n=2 Tax=Glycine subgen. Soja TaxID=1462606 RepID=K7L5K3_SOYBN|nr:hypothetical protein JHK87_020713 [Glycine soja]KAG5015129.1 hypothetical protein JHK85_021265 [Glycine max]KAG5024913.1 hypothetical protein JHK86_020827 [Glycine max]KAG5136083.1 hypothetical protein JHK82_020814 [Glycine max]KAH1050266.1 hypothetical protein GYH30_020647 [Glycine max]